MTQEVPNHLLRFADDLEALFYGRIDAEVFETKYRSIQQPPDIDEFMAWVDHFLIDADIRARDEGYREMQEREMLGLIEHLRAGRLDLARRITFLRPTRDAP